MDPRKKWGLAEVKPYLGWNPDDSERTELNTAHPGQEVTPDDASSSTCGRPL